MTNNEELKSCPCCGGEAQLITDHIMRKHPCSFIICKRCLISTKEYFDVPFFDKKGKEEAIAAWNKRMEGK